MIFGPLVEPVWLRDHISDENVRLIDFRWYLAGRNGRDEYLRGHIPGAVFVEMDSLTGAGPGRHPLPTAAQFEKEMRKAGVSADTRVVIYDDEGGSVAARLWFMLGWFGHDEQAVLNGGLPAWGSPLERDIPHVEPGTFTAREPDQSRVLDFAAVRQLRGVPLLDARVPERYRGDIEPVDPKAGHIPGALNAPWKENLGADGRFKSPDELRRHYEELGAGEGAVAYCGSGVTACHDVLAMQIAGLPNVRLYGGSWSDWSNRDAPVATGPKP